MMSRNCLGFEGRLAGQKRVPDPPAMITQNIPDPPAGSGAPKIVLKTLDILFAYDLPRLKLNDHKIAVAGVREAMNGAEGDVDRCSRLEPVFMSVDERRPLAREYIEVLSAVAVALQTKAFAGQDGDAFYPQARFVGYDSEGAPRADIHTEVCITPLLAWQYIGIATIGGQRDCARRRRPSLGGGVDIRLEIGID